MFYNNWKENTLFDDLRCARVAAKAELSSKVNRGSMTYSARTKEMETIENAWSKGFNAQLKEKLGIESEGLGMVKGTWQRFQSLGNHTRPKIIFSTVFTTAAAIGGYILINQNAHMKRDLLSKQDQLDQERQNAPARHTQR